MISSTSQLIGLVESNNEPGAVRYEPEWRYVTPELIKACKQAHFPCYMSDVTAKALMSFSYGKYQIMGSVLYELGYKGTLLQFQNDTTLQDAWFEKFLRARNIYFTLAELVASAAKRLLFATRYNGDGPGYANKLMRAMRANGVI